MYHGVLNAIYFIYGHSTNPIFNTIAILLELKHQTALNMIKLNAIKNKLIHFNHLNIQPSGGSM